MRKLKDMVLNNGGISMPNIRIYQVSVEGVKVQYAQYK